MILYRPGMPGKRWAASTLLALSLLAVGTPPQAAASAAPEVPLEEINAVTTQVAFGLRRPVAIAAPDDGTDRLFIVEKRGTVRVYHPDTGLAPDPIIDITSSVDESGNERGLLGIALSPASPTTTSCTSPTRRCRTARSPSPGTTWTTRASTRCSPRSTARTPTTTAATSPSAPTACST
ncbi:hypothetical protein GCM10020001_101490 [Nonomuraea salmonea]